MFHKLKYKTLCLFLRFVSNYGTGNCVDCTSITNVSTIAVCEECYVLRIKKWDRQTRFVMTEKRIGLNLYPYQKKYLFNGKIHI